MNERTFALVHFVLAYNIFNFHTWFVTGVVPKPTRQIPQAGAGSRSGRGRRQVQLREEIWLKRWRQQRRQIRWPRQHRRTGPEPSAHLQLRGTEPHRRAGQHHRERTGGPSEDLCVHRHGRDSAEPRLGSRARHHHLYPGLFGWAVRQCTVVFAKTERSQSHVSKDQHVLMNLHSGKVNKEGKNGFPVFRRLKSNCPTQREESYWKKEDESCYFILAPRSSLWSVDTVAVKISILTSHIVLERNFFSKHVLWARRGFQPWTEITWA